jgi:hypothetical protein
MHPMRMASFELWARKEKTVVTSLFLGGSGKRDVKAVHDAIEGRGAVNMRIAFKCWANYSRIFKELVAIILMENKADDKTSSLFVEVWW